MVSDTSEKLLGKYEIGVGNSDYKNHNVVKVVSLDIAVAVEIAAENELEEFLVKHEDPWSQDSGQAMLPTDS